jgi:hypothetical protein
MTAVMERVAVSVQEEGGPGHVRIVIAGPETWGVRAKAEDIPRCLRIHACHRCWVLPGNVISSFCMTTTRSFNVPKYLRKTIL